MSTTNKFGFRRKQPPKLRRPYLTFEDKRLIAKQIVAGKTNKWVASEWKISLATLCKVRKEFVVLSLREAHPDVPEQGALPLPYTPQNAPAAF